MKRILITGFSGFVSRHFLEYLDNLGEKAVIQGIDLLAPRFPIDAYKGITCSFEKIDLLDRNQVGNVIYQFKPDLILHLASYSSVAYSWKDPIASFQNNTNVFLNMLETVRGLGIECRILSVGSSEEYGNVSEHDLPLREDHPLTPVSPYAVARVSQEMLTRIFVEGYGMDIVMTRSFNHIGPYQKDIFAVASFARQIVEAAKRGEKQAELVTGDVSIVRDFVDVRDVVAAYFTLLNKGAKGAVYNICGGQGVSLREIIERMAAVAGIGVSIHVNEKFIRPMDNRAIVGSFEKIKRDLGWEPRILLERSLRDIIEYWKTQV